MRRNCISDICDFLSLPQTNAVGSFFFVFYIDLKIIMGFNILNCFFQIRSILMGMKWIRIVMFV